MAKRGGYRITPAWQEAARRDLAAIGWTAEHLAKKLGCAQSTAWDILNSPEQKSSALVPKIHKILGWQTPEEVPFGPMPKKPTPEAAEAVDLMDQLPEPLRKARLLELRALVDALKQSKPSND